MSKQYWYCIIGGVEQDNLPFGSDSILRQPVRDAFNQAFGQDKTCASGWGINEERYNAICTLMMYDTDTLKDLVKGALFNKVVESPKPVKILAFYGKEPVLELTTCEIEGPNYGKRYGLHRERDNPSNMINWGDLWNTPIDRCKEVNLTSELKITLLEDLAFCYGQQSAKFNAKLKEFGFI